MWKLKELGIRNVFRKEKKQEKDKDEPGTSTVATNCSDSDSDENAPENCPSGLPPVDRGKKVLVGSTGPNPELARPHGLMG